MELEPGSFRDRDSRVFYSAGDVYRELSQRGLEDWERLEQTELFKHFTHERRLVETERVDGESPNVLAGSAAGLLKHARVPFVSYAYEWPFGMLRDAARLTLELLSAAIDEDMVLKDATPYNVQWRGARPVFIDIPSFVRLEPGEAWPGYRQFCELFLYPLFLTAYRGVSFHPWLRGSIDGISSEECWRLCSARDLLRPGVLVRVWLQSRLDARHARQGLAGSDVKRGLRDAGFHKELIQANAKKLLGLCSKLRWEPAGSVWSDYSGDNTYDDERRASKAEFVRRAVGARTRGLVWDLGCNTGEYARIAAESADYVVAMDGDHLAVQRLYEELRREERDDILPLVVNLADASPNLGWRGAERKDLAGRGKPDMVLALALVHHVVIAANVPLADFVDWLASLGGDLVIEFVSKEDPMVRVLLRDKEDVYLDYDASVLEACLSRTFRIERRETLSGGTRTLYHAVKNDDA